ncbi:MAG: aromatic acid exporter family protein, partial [Eubacteriaceae bacterium]
MPKIGMRTFKTFVAVYLCFLIYILRGQEGSPFYSSIAAILCMQPYVQNSLNVALNRTIGTLMGGTMGLMFL